VHEDVPLVPPVVDFRANVLYARFIPNRTRRDGSALVSRMGEVAAENARTE